MEGDVISLPVNDLGLLYGATVFTTLRVYDRSLDHPLTNWDAHCDRTYHSIKIFDWIMPNWQRIKKEAQYLTNYYPVLRVTVFPDGKELILGRSLPDNLQEKQQSGISAKVIIDHHNNRSLPNHKTGNYLTPFLSLNKAKKDGFQEAILTDNNGNWLETSTGNLWGYVDGDWFTPLISEGILPGIARNVIIRNANFSVKENVWNPYFIEKLEAIAHSNSVIEVVPFHTINVNEKILNFDPYHPAIQQLKNVFMNLI
ncbi:aminotransferase class IV [Cyanobacterium stanieri LEGE 03274]|uniref:Aminotransferase class IV n=2 Tax=Cyanobacterium TaxID=102234 RepID=A0ABR9V7S7_9CHRO|nr:aminotransferase class IV [Cyanobacterium stanieri]MBE9223599.1 aminotransferase class IV [Cyanobacterium stanieri LEGE 03274]